MQQLDEQQPPTVRFEKRIITTSLGPVCASNGLVFANSYEAFQAGLKTIRALSPTVKPGSKCPVCDAKKTLFSSLDVQIVCGSDGIVYNNPDDAKCAGVTTFRQVPANVLLPRGTCNPTSGAAAGRAQLAVVVGAVLLSLVIHS